MKTVEEEIIEMVDRETQAWNRLDLDVLLSIFHPDMVWPWPPDIKSHDPMEWVMGMGKFDLQRWKKVWQDLFNTHALVHNSRSIKRIVVSEDRNGAFAVVDIDTLWVHNEHQTHSHWKGRTCKIYTRVEGDWKMIFQTGALDYNGD